MTIHKLGKRPAKADARTFNLSKYLLNAVPPPQENWIKPSVLLPMYGNDLLGDCVPAAAGHLSNLWNSWTGPTLPEIPLTAIIKAYSDISGYVPGEPWTDNGAFLLDMLRYWRKTGIAGHKILAFVSIKAGDLMELEQATWLFGGAYIGLQLPITAQGKKEWSVPGSLQGIGAPGSWGGHCVPAAAYDWAKVPRFRNSVITWGQTMPMSNYFYQCYCDEAYAVLSMDWLDMSMHAPNSFDLAALQADLAAL